MGWKTRTELVPEAGETAIEEDVMYFATGSAMVVGADGEARVHVRWRGSTLIVDDKDEPIGWSAAFVASVPAHELEVDDGWKIVRVYHDRSRNKIPPGIMIDPELDMFSTPLGPARLFWVVPF